MRIVSLILFALLFCGCIKTTQTGRLQFNNYNEQEEMEIGKAQSQEILKANKVSKNKKQKAVLNRVAKRIIKAADKPEFEWEINLIEGKTINAFVLPGGKIFVYTGLMKLISKDDELAAVLGHEVSHALLHHGTERMSMSSAGDLAVSAATIGAAVAAGALSTTGKNDPKTKLITYGTAVGTSLAKTYLIDLPYSRSHELEADKYGVELAIKAGYDPKYAIAFWEKMSKVGGDSKVEFLSTHPSDENRIKQIQELIDEKKGTKK